MSYKAVIFDLDGTLVNTLEDLADAMNYALAELGQPEHTVDECRKMVGNAIYTFARRALRPDMQHLHKQLVNKMKKRYDKTSRNKSRLYDGIAEVVSQLKKRGIRLGVVTNKNHDNAVEVVEYYFGEDVFEFITGVTGESRVKPDPSGTIDIVSKMGINCDECIFVGDSEVDIQTAINAGVKAVGVTWGFRSRDELAAAGADIIIDRPGEILELANGDWS